MPARMPWTVLVHVVARRPVGTFGDPRYINAKADEVRDKLVAAAKGRAMYVAYNIVYDPSDGLAEHQDPVAAILNSNVANIKGRFTKNASGGTLQEELLGFYAWALPQCPAEHYAVFFWGHSLGPAGLFESGERVLLPPRLARAPHARSRRLTTRKRASAEIASAQINSAEIKRIQISCCEIRKVLRKARRALVADSGSDPARLTEEILTASSEDTIVHAQSGRDAKMDVVFFQDCWMSTLETAFELQDSAHFVVASQSLVPFGKPSVETCGLDAQPPGIGVWPYDRLFDTLAGVTCAPPQCGPETLVKNLADFYDSDGLSHLWPNPSVPFTLLDLNKIRDDDIGPSIKAVIAAFKRVKTEKSDRGALMDSASIAVAGPRVCRGRRGPRQELAAGSIALIDFKRFCQLLAAEALTEEERRAVDKLLNSKLIAGHRESVDRSFKVIRPEEGNDPRALNGSLGFEGISAFYYPTKKRARKWGRRDTNIFLELESSQIFYQDLAFNQETGWADQLAFDQLPMD